MTRETPSAAAGTHAVHPSPGSGGLDPAVEDAGHAGRISYRLCGEVDGARRVFHLNAGVNRLGTRADNDVVLPARGVSRHHAEITVTSTAVTVRDLGSKNGVHLGGRQIAAGELVPGDRIRLGPVDLELELLDEEDASLAIELPLPRRPPAALSPPDPTPYLSTRGMRTGRSPEGAGLVFPPGHVPCPSPAMALLYQQMRSAAGSALPVMLFGETGVGKELLARTIHLSSMRSAGPLVTVNCAAIPVELLEAEMFGIGKGVATGVDAREGRFRLADGGTLFLDEVGEMPPSLQAKLLRALESGEIHPVGRPPLPVDVRVVAATNADLLARAAAGSFREDLYYRLAGCVLEVPPLRRRGEDVPVLVGHFLRRAAERADKAVRGVSRRALDRLVAHPWPGNVRELRYEIERLVHLCPQDGVIDSSLLAAYRSGGGTAGGGTAGGGTAGGGSVAAAAADPADDLRHAETLRLSDHVEPLERRLVTEALRRTGGNRSRAAELLGMSRNGLAYKMKSLGLDG